MSAIFPASLSKCLGRFIAQGLKYGKSFFCPAHVHQPKLCFRPEGHKRAHLDLIQRAVERFATEQGFIQCRDLRIRKVGGRFVGQIEASCQGTSRGKDKATRADAVRSCFDALYAIPEVVRRDFDVWRIEIVEIHEMRSMSLSRCQRQYAIARHTLFKCRARCLSIQRHRGRFKKRQELPAVGGTEALSQRLQHW